MFDLPGDGIPASRPVGHQGKPRAPNTRRLQGREVGTDHFLVNTSDAHQPAAGPRDSIQDGRIIGDVGGRLATLPADPVSTDADCTE